MKVCRACSGAGAGARGARSAHAVLLRLLLMMLLMLLLWLFHAAVVAAPAASDVYVPDGVLVAHTLVFGESCCCRCIVAVAIMVLVASTGSMKNTIQSRNVRPLLGHMVPRPVPVAGQACFCP